MGIRNTVAFVLALAIALPQAAEAATAKKKTVAKPAAKSAPAQLRKTGDGPMGSFVAAPDNQVFVNLVGFIYGLPTIGYEQALNNDNSWTAQLGFRNYGASNFNLNFLGVLGSYRWWLGDHAKMQGFYAGPLGTVQMVNVNYDATTINGAITTTKKESANSFIFGVGGEGGYQWILPSNFTFSAGLNAGYYFGSLSLGSGAPSIPFGGLGAGLNGTVGYAF